MKRTTQPMHLLAPHSLPPTGMAQLTGGCCLEDDPSPAPPPSPPDDDENTAVTNSIITG